MPICTLPLQFFFSCHHIDSFFIIFYYTSLGKFSPRNPDSTPKNPKRWACSLIQRLVKKYSDWTSARLSCLGSRLSRNKHKWGFLGNALGIRSCESERRKQDWTEGEVEQQCILNGNLSQPMGSLNLGNRQGLYNHQQLFPRCGTPWRRRWSWVWKVSSAEAVLVGGWQPRTVCLPHRLQWQTQSFVSREESSCRRYAYTVTPKEILGQTDIQSKTYCSKIYCMWLEASRDTLDPNACLREYNCKTHAGGVDVSSCYLQVIIVGWGWRGA